MMNLVQQLRIRLFPPLPEAIRDEFVLMTAAQLQVQSRMLFLALFLTVPTAAYAYSAGAPWFVRFGLPAIMGGACFAGFLSLSRDLKISTSVRRARKLIRQSTWSSSALALVCSSWCVVSWLGAPADTKIYYPLILSMGALSTAYCLSSVRSAALLNLAIDMLPISALLLASGNRLDLAAGVSMAVATFFLLRMIVLRHRDLVSLLELKRQMRVQASTDPLTGLLNRRAFDLQVEAEHATAEKSGRVFSIALIDLNGFKPINDSYGHATGDQLLCEVARRLLDACGQEGQVARMGGDEFAVLVPARSAIKREVIADRLLGALARPCDIGGHRIPISAGMGVAHWPKDASAISGLFEAADHALYAAKGIQIVPNANATCSNGRVQPIRVA
ncbi:GGDEF domain-containing protein [Sphingomonas alpina]|nr:diguanylate cyclase [Sphingomonas alpina]